MNFKLFWPLVHVFKQFVALVFVNKGVWVLGAMWAAMAPAWALDTEALPADWSLNHRKIATLRATWSGDTPAERVELARQALDLALEAQGPGVVNRVRVNEGWRLDLDGHPVVLLVPGDQGVARPVALLEPLGREVAQRLQQAVAESRERTDPRQLARGAALSAVFTVLAYGLLRAVWRLRRWLDVRVRRRLRRQQRQSAVGRLVLEHLTPVHRAVRTASTALTWGLTVLLLDAWATLVLRQFAYTRPWGERSTDWLLERLGQFASAVASAVPGLLVAVFIFVVARWVARAASLLLQRIERGELQVRGIDADTALPTRRLIGGCIWLFALAMAYPYLPGADSEAFKGVSVLTGLMLSLGASSVVGQALSGFSLLYAKAWRVGEYVRVGDTEGTVVALGLFTTRIHTGLGEEVSVPNSVAFGQPIRNFSRLVHDGRFMVHVTVTIGYDTPWRQVHALLLEAARRAPGVADEPQPFVVQTALSDFYVEYRLCAQSHRNAPARRAEVISQLHAAVQDLFNENGVQILSPHYMADPPRPHVVPPGPWASVPAAGRTPPPGGA